MKGRAILFSVLLVVSAMGTSGAVPGGQAADAVANESTATPTLAETPANDTETPTQTPTPTPTPVNRTETPTQTPTPTPIPVNRTETPTQTPTPTPTNETENETEVSTETREPGTAGEALVDTTPLSGLVNRSPEPRPRDKNGSRNSAAIRYVLENVSSGVTFRYRTRVRAEEPGLPSGEYTVRVETADGATIDRLPGTATVTPAGDLVRIIEIGADSIDAATDTAQDQEFEPRVVVGREAYRSNDTVRVAVGAVDREGPVPRPVGGVELNVTLISPTGSDSRIVSTSASGTTTVPFDLVDRPDGYYRVNVESTATGETRSEYFDVGPRLTVYPRYEETVEVDRETTVAVSVTERERPVSDRTVDVTLQRPDGSTVIRTLTTDDDGFATTNVTATTAGSYYVYPTNIPGSGAEFTAAPVLGSVRANGEEFSADIKPGETVSLTGRLTDDGLPATGTEAVVRVLNVTGSDNVPVANLSVTTNQYGQFATEWQAPLGSERDFRRFEAQLFTTGGDRIDADAADIYVRSSGGSGDDISVDIEYLSPTYEGVFRPGETVAATVSVRGPEGAAASGVPVSYALQYDFSGVVAANGTAVTDENGVARVTVPTSTDAPAGAELRLQAVVELDGITASDTGYGSLRPVRVTDEERPFEVTPGDRSGYRARFVETGDSLVPSDVSRGENGAFNLRSIGLDEARVGEIDTNDPSGIRGFYEPVTFNGTAGQQVRIDMFSNDDPYLKLRAPGGNIVAENDDADGLDSSITRELQQTGEYTVIATSFGSEDTFRYGLSVRANPGVGGVPTTVVGVYQDRLHGSVFATEATVSDGDGSVSVETSVPGELTGEGAYEVRHPFVGYTDTNTFEAAPYGVTIDGLPDRDLRPGETVTLNYTTTAPDTTGAVLTLRTFDDAAPTSSVAVRTTEREPVTFTAPRPNETASYEVQVRTVNESGYTASTDEFRRVLGTETPGSSLLADAGRDVTVTEGETVTLDGTGSEILTGNGTLEYSWVQTRGPAVTLSSASGATPVFTAPALEFEEELEFELTVSDGEKSATDEVEVTVRPNGPELRGVSVLNETVRSGERLATTVNASDPDGITDIEVGLEGSLGDRTFFLNVDRRFDTSRPNGTYVVAGPLDRVPSGTYTVSSVSLEDGAENELDYRDEELPARPTVEVRTDATDFRPPVIERVEARNDTVRPGDRFVLAVNVSDPSGIRGIDASLRSSSTSDSIRLDRRFETPQPNGTYLLATTVERVSGGTYRLNSIDVEDGNGVDEYYSRDELPRRPTVEVDTTGVDVEGPRISSITVRNGSVSPGETLVAAVTVTDASDIESVDLEFESADGQRLFVDRFFDAPVEPGTIHLRTTVPRLPNGSYTLASASARDTADNDRFYGSDELPNEAVVVDSSATDFEPPQLLSVDVVNETLRPGEVVGVRVNASDTSGVESVDVRLRPVDDDSDTESYFLDRQFDPPRDDGSYLLTTRLEDRVPNGTVYTVDSVTLTDGVGNREFYSEGELPSGATATVLSDATDFEGPRIRSVTVLNETVRPDDRIQARVNVTDATNVSSIELEFSRGTEGEFEIRLDERFSEPRGNGSYLINGTVRRLPDGTYNLSSASTRDGLDNYRFYGNDELPAQGSVVVNSNATDFEGPRVSDVRLLNDSVERGDRLAVAVDLRDASAIDQISVDLELANSDQFERIGLDRYRVGGTRNGTYVLSERIGQYLTNGTYRVTDISVSDEFSNDRYYDDDELSEQPTVVVGPTEPDSTTGELTRLTPDGVIYQTGRVISAPEQFTAGQTVDVSLRVEAQTSSASSNIVYGAVGSGDGTLYGLTEMGSLGTGNVTVTATLPSNATGDLYWTWVPATSDSEAREKATVSLREKDGENVTSTSGLSNDGRIAYRLGEVTTDDGGPGTEPTPTPVTPTPTEPEPTPTPTPVTPTPTEPEPTPTPTPVTPTPTEPEPTPTPIETEPTPTAVPTPTPTDTPETPTEPEPTPTPTPTPTEPGPTPTPTPTPTDPSTFEVVQVTVTDRVTVGDPLEASATIRNTGSVGSQSLSVGLDTDQDGTLDDTEVETSVRRTLDGDETRTVTFSLETSGLDPGQFDLVVRSANDSGTAETLLEPDFPPAPPSNPANGDGTGDPHLTTFDGVSYDFQAAGEFVLAREPSGSLAVQGRLVPVSNRAVSVIEAVATTLDGRNVTIDAADSTPLTVSGVDQPLADGDNVTVGNGTVFRRGDTFVVIYPGEDDRLSDGDERLRVDVRGDRVDVRVVLDDQRTKAVEGLLGSPNGNRTDDIAYANGTALDRPLSLGELYGPYRADYRVTSDTSLFDYDAGESTAGFFLPDYPGEIVTVESLDEDERRAAAEQARKAGLTPGTPAFENAVLDFALTGDPSYIQSASESVATNATADVTTRSSDRILVTATTDGATSLGPNGTLRIPVEIDTGDRSVYAVQADLRYDTNVLDVVSVSNGSFLGPDAITVAERVNDSAGRVRYGATATGDADVSGAGTLLTVTARVNGSAEAGASTRLRLTGVGLSDRNGARVNATVRGTAVSVATVDLPNLTASPERDVNYAGRRVPISVNAGGADLARIEAAPTRAPERARGISCAGGPPCSGTVGVTATGPTWNATTQSYEETSFRVTAVTENGRRVTRTVRTTVRLPGDVNPDGTVDILDAVQLGQGWRSRAGGPDYSSAADLTGDGRVDVFDAVVLGQNFGRQTASGAGNESDTSEPTETFEITNIGASYYEVDGAEQPTLTLQRGETYRFNVSASGHPFHVSTDPNGGDLGDIYTEGVEVSSPAEMNGGAVEDGTLTFTVPESAPDTLYYQCGVHAGMGAEIVVEG